jgi:hypothetical protein
MATGASQKSKRKRQEAKVRGPAALTFAFCALTFDLPFCFTLQTLPFTL